MGFTLVDKDSCAGRRPVVGDIVRRPDGKAALLNDSIACRTFPFVLCCGCASFPAIKTCPFIGAQLCRNKLLHQRCDGGDACIERYPRRHGLSLWRCSWPLLRLGGRYSSQQTDSDLLSE